MNLSDLKIKAPEELQKLAEEMEVENASTLKKQDLIYSILRKAATNREERKVLASIFNLNAIKTTPDHQIN